MISPSAGDADAVQLAGPALRYRQLATELRRHGVEVTLASRGPGGDADWSLTRPLALARGHAAVVCPQGLADEAAELARRLPAGVRSRARLLRARTRGARAARPGRRALLGLPPARSRRSGGADLLLVANEPQRAYAMGMLSGLGRAAPERTAPSIVVAPMAAPPVRPAGAGPVRRSCSGIGGLWRWFDGETAIGRFRCAARPPGSRFPHPRRRAPAWRGAGHARRRAGRGRPRGRGPDRGPPGPSPDALPHLLEQASCALCLAHDGFEHRLAQRTRLLDLLSSGVPIVCTEGDALGGARFRRVPRRRWRPVIRRPPRERSRRYSATRSRVRRRHGRGGSSRARSPRSARSPRPSRGSPLR